MFCYPTHTQQSHSPSQTTSRSPSGERAKEEVQRQREGRLGKKGKQIREVDDISHILTGGALDGKEGSTEGCQRGGVEKGGGR